MCKKFYKLARKYMDTCVKILHLFLVITFITFILLVRTRAFLLFKINFKFMYYSLYQYGNGISDANKLTCKLYYIRNELEEKVKNCEIPIRWVSPFMLNISNVKYTSYLFY